MKDANFAGKLCENHPLRKIQFVSTNQLLYCDADDCIEITMKKVGWVKAEKLAAVEAEVGRLKARIAEMEQKAEDDYYDALESAERGDE